QQVVMGRDYADPGDAAIHLEEAICLKEKKRRRPDWKLPNCTILVVQIVDAPIQSVACFLDRQVLDELFSSAGFCEIWLADYTVAERFQTVQLFGIKPRRWQGLHDHLRTGSKHYG